jgi:hypothetical protein
VEFIMADIGFGYFRGQLKRQIATGVPVKIYCPVCYWGSIGVGNTFCAYGHGERIDIINFVEELTSGI